MAAFEGRALPNPPAALLDDSGAIRFSFGFYLESQRTNAFRALR